MDSKQLRERYEGIRADVDAGKLSQFEAKELRLQATQIHKTKVSETAFVGHSGPGAIPELIVDSWDPHAQKEGFPYHPLMRYLGVIKVLLEIYSLGADKRHPVTGEAIVRKLPKPENVKKVRAPWRGGRKLPDDTAVVFALKWKREMVWLPTLKEEVINLANARINNDPYASAYARARELSNNGFKVAILQPTYPMTEPPKDGYALKDQTIVGANGRELFEHELQSLFQWLPHMAKTDITSSKEDVEFAYKVAQEQVPIPYGEREFLVRYANGMSKVFCIIDSELVEKVTVGAVLIGGSNLDFNPPAEPEGIQFFILLQSEVSLGASNGETVGMIPQWEKPKADDYALDENGKRYQVENEKGKLVFVKEAGTGALRTAEEFALYFQASAGQGEDNVSADAVAFYCPDLKKWQRVTRGQALENHEEPTRGERTATPFMHQTDADQIFLGYASEEDEKGNVVPCDEFLKLTLEDKNRITKREMDEPRVHITEMHAPRTRVDYTYKQDDEGKTIPGSGRHCWGNAKDSKSTSTRKERAEQSFLRGLSESDRRFLS